MYKVLILGAGKIGSLIALLLAQSEPYQVYLADINLDTSELKTLQQIAPTLTTIKVDVMDAVAMDKLLQAQQFDAIISCLPYFCNSAVAKLAHDHQLHYFDLTEDASVAEFVRQISHSSDKAFVPQSGLAPGLVSIVANHLMQEFELLDTVKLRVGALPANSSNALHYSLTWSTDGMINQYGNACHAIENNLPVLLQPLTGLELVELDGSQYEAFNTSGGLGSLAHTYADKVRVMNYKTLRYPGHCEKMSFLMNDLKLNNDRPTLKRILEQAIPKTHQDVVILYVSVSGGSSRVDLQACKLEYSIVSPK